MNGGAVASVTRTNSPVTDIWSRDDSYQWAGKDPRYGFGTVMKAALASPVKSLRTE
jgi:hypothetical protein